MTPYPRWFQQLRTYYASNSARMFVLHFNVDDYVIDGTAASNPITRLVPFLERYARNTKAADGKPFDAIFRYSHSQDVVPDDRMDETLLNIGQGTVLGALGGGALGGMMSGSPLAGAAGAGVGAAVGSSVLTRTSDTFSRDIYTQEARSITDLSPPEKVLRVLERLLRMPTPRSLVIIEHVETLAPREYPDAGQLINSEILKRWATDYVFRSTDNWCILITRDLQLIDPGIYAPGTNCFPIHIDLPDDSERAVFLDYMEREVEQERMWSGGGPVRMRRNSLISGLAQIDPKLREALERGQQATDRRDQVRVLGKVAQGFRLVEIDQLNRQVRAEHAIAQQGASSHSDSPLGPSANGNTALPPTAEPIIRLDDIKRHKRRAINEQSNGLLEIIDVTRGFDAIGGMEIVKTYLRALSRRILASSIDGRYHHLIPRGLILSGPPGTGKTIIAEALALESNLNMVKLRNVREGLVGASERNLTRAFDVIKALSPILVFVDEIDQAFGGRGLGQSSDGGTSERIFGQILEFLGDDRNRGNVIWIAASNRPDVLDAALLRRFDRIIPCLLPTPQEQALILEAMPKSIRTLQFSPALEALIAARAPEIIELFQNKPGLLPTGAVIETIARRAAEGAGDRARGGVGTTAVELKDLRLAIEDYRSNANATMYDYQSLLSIQACNFYSVMPELPARSPFSDLIERRDVPLGSPDGEGIVIPEYWRNYRLSYGELDKQIRGYRMQLGLARREEGGV